MSKRGLFLVICIMFLMIIGLIISLTNQEQANDRLQAQIVKPQERTVIEEPYTIIHSEDNYVYLDRLEIDTNKLTHATRYTDINGVTWLEIEQDGYITVYVKGHIAPDEVHWYAPY